MWTALLVPCALATPAAAPASSTAPLPIAFEPAAGGGFVARAPGGAARISPGGAVIAAHGARPVRLRPAGGARTPRVSAGARAPGVVNRLAGAGWRTGIPLYRSVVQRGVYPGVDLVFHTRRGARSSTTSSSARAPIRDACGSRSTARAASRSAAAATC